MNTNKPFNTPDHHEKGGAPVDTSLGPNRASLNRSSFLTRAGLVAATTLVGLDLSGGLFPGSPSKVEAADIGPQSSDLRAQVAFQTRVDAAQYQRNYQSPAHPDNGDEALYPTRFASYSKGLPHDNLGDVDTNAYGRLLTALTSGANNDFEAIPLGGARHLASPQAAYAYQLEGADSHAFAVPPAPTFTSAQTQAEMAECYWMALCRDIAFDSYATNATAQQAAADLSRFSGYQGPTSNGQVTPATLFRDNLPGTLVGPYVSQFLLKDAPYGAQTLSQRIRTRVAGDDRVLSVADWLGIQNGQQPSAGGTYDTTARYIRNGRDLTEWVHGDFVIQSALNAALLIVAQANSGDAKFAPAVYDQANPYLSSRTQSGFVTFGNGDLFTLVGRVGLYGLKAAWYQKWLVHRRLRPEEYGGRVHNALTGVRSYPIGADLRNSSVLGAVYNYTKGKTDAGTYLLPQAYPEGSPVHPAYPSGHAVFIGAGVTVLKAFCDESLPVVNAVAVSPDGLSLTAYSGQTLTIGGELNKLASNIAQGRILAGVHWRSDDVEGIKLGEQVAIRFLQDLKRLYNEPFGGFSLTKFDGTTITVTT